MQWIRLRCRYQLTELFLPSEDIRGHQDATRVRITQSHAHIWIMVSIRYGVEDVGTVWCKTSTPSLVNRAYHGWLPSPFRLLPSRPR